MKLWQTWLIPLLALLAFTGVYATGTNHTLFAAINAIGPHTSDLLWAHITVLGDTLVALALCLPLWRRRPDLLWALLITLLLGTAWVHLLKPLFDVARPPAVLDTLHVIGPAYRAGSFPSGHATTAFAIGGMLALGLASRALAAAIVVIAVAIALSRVVVGVHWPLDVLAGAFGGWLAAASALWIARRTLSFGTRDWVQWILGILLVVCAAWLVKGHPNSGYPQTDLLQRAIGLAGLLSAGARLIRDFRRRPGL